MPLLRPSLIASAVLAFATTVSAQAKPAAEGKFMVRVRALSLTPANKSDAIPSLGVKADAITVSSKVFPDIDIAYYATPKLAVELVLTYPQQHDVKLNDAKIGTFKHLPPTLLAQYHFAPQAKVRPYVGAGVNLTLISDVNINVPGVGKLDLEKSSVGAAGQIGVDIKLLPGKFLNIDVKKVMIASDVKAGGAKVSNVKVDPILASVGFGIRF